MTMQTTPLPRSRTVERGPRRGWARWPAFGVAALTALVLATPAAAQWRDDGYRRGGPGYGRYVNPAFNQGFQDGYDKGRDDAQDRDRYDVRRHSRYRSADHGYNRRFGSKDAYRQVYRNGFESGYSQGYREYARNGRGYPNRNRGPWWRY